MVYMRCVWTLNGVWQSARTNWKMFEVNPHADRATQFTDRTTHEHIMWFETIALVAYKWWWRVARCGGGPEPPPQFEYSNVRAYTCIRYSNVRAFDNVCVPCRRGKRQWIPLSGFRTNFFTAEFQVLTVSTKGIWNSRWLLILRNFCGYYCYE